MDLTEKQIEEIVSKFLCWKLPTDFNPDGGIEFKKTYGSMVHGKYQDVERTPDSVGFWPIGTNLLNATQAKEMVEHILGVERNSTKRCC